jgi:hypothetical protein
VPAELVAEVVEDTVMEAAIAHTAPADAERPAYRPAISSGENRPRWNPLTRILFRFVFAYFFLYIFPFPVPEVLGYASRVDAWLAEKGYLPTKKEDAKESKGEQGAQEEPKGIVERILKKYQDYEDAVVQWVGPHVLGVEVKIFRPTGSGDTTFDFVRMFTFLSVAFAVTVAWSLVDWKRRAYPLLFQWLRVWVRYYLAFFMISYGAYKVIQAQFPAPGLDRLLQPFGDASPMGLVWTFMGASQGYNFFAGAGEMLGGLLLFARRTTLLGALVTIGVMSNVAALNFFYDVPVKLFSSHLLLAAFFLVAPDLRRLIDLLVLRRAVSPVEYQPFLARWRVLRPIGLFLWALVVAGYVGVQLYDVETQRATFSGMRSPFYGIWNVEELETDGKARPPLTTDADRWRRVIFDFPQVISIHLMSGTPLRYGLKLDEEKKVFTVSSRRTEKKWSTELAYTQPEEGVMTLEGTLEGKKIKARLRRTDPGEFLLRNRGFHWINEYPYNR